uniref:KHA domain-containing protein n=1 Tax=Macaca fascicularis TaxID=9541 RepID=A0A7N9D9G7_MACFA
MRRVTLFLNSSPKNRKMVAVYGTLSDLLSAASGKLGIKATSVYNGKGRLIDDIALIRDDDVLFFGIDSLIEHLGVAIKNSQPLEDHSPISRKEFV